MQDMQTVIILLSIIVGILSIVIVVLLGLIITLLIKVNRVTKRIDSITTNFAKATEWLSPSKVFSGIASLFGK